MNEWQKEELRKMKELVKQLKELSGLDFELIKENDRFSVKLANKPIQVRGKDYNKRYVFFLVHELPYVGYETQRVASENLVKPQKVGVLSKKKILDWVGYLAQTYIALEEISKERVAKVEKFIKKMKEAKAEIKEENGLYRGWIKRNGIEYKFEIGKEGYIAENIELDCKYTDKPYETFLKISDNKYKGGV